MRKWGVILLFNFGFQLALNAAGFISSNHVGIEHGLSQSSANAIIQDRFGFVWIATNDGLNRFDGQRFEIFDVPEFDSTGFQNNSFTALCYDQDDNLWCGTNASLYCFDNRLRHFIPVRLNSSEQNPEGERIFVRKIFQRKSGQILVLTPRRVLKYTSDNKLESIKLNTDENKIVRLQTLFEDNKNRLWLGTSNGLLAYDEASGIFNPYGSFGINNLPIIEIANHENGGLIVYSTNKIFIIDSEQNSFYEPGINNSLKGYQFTSIFTDRDRNVWLGTSENGLLQLNQNFNEIKSVYNVENELIHSNQIKSITQDLHGLVWVGTADNGVFILNLDEQMIRKAESGKLLPSGVTCMVPVPEVTGKLWAGTAHHGIVLLDYSDFDNVQIAKVPNNFLKKLDQCKINSMLCYKQRLYVATQDKGLVCLKTNHEQFISVESFSSLEESGKELGALSDLVLGTDQLIYFSSNLHGLCCFNPATRKIKQVPLVIETDEVSRNKRYRDHWITSIYSDPKGYLWIGADGTGLFRLNLQNPQAQVEYFNFDVLFKYPINCIYKSGKTLYIGTQGIGLVEIDLESQKLNRIDTRVGMASNVVRSVVADFQGNIWLGTNRGMSKYVPQNKTVINYTGSYYLQGYEFNDNAVTIDPQGTLFFSGMGGINFLKPSESVANQEAPLIQISELLINNQKIMPGMVYNERVVIDKPVEMLEQLVLNHRDRVLTFTISPIHFSDSRNNIFYYQLEPFDKNWVKRDMSNRYVTYNNLKGGDYRFKIKALSSDGIMSEVKTLYVKVKPPLWEKAWFNLLIYSLAGLFIALLFLIWYRNQKQREFQLEHEKNTMQSLIDNIPDSIYFKDLQSRFTRINLAQAKLMGLTDKDQALGKTDFEFFEHADDAFRVEQEIVRTGIPIINHFHKLNIEGKIRYLSDTKIALYDKDKKCIGTVGVSRDLTDLKLAEEAMLESQAKFRALFENAPLAIFRIDKDQRIVEYNHRFGNMFGYSKTDDLTNLITSDLLVDPELGNLIIETVLETKEVNAEINLKRKDGTTFIANLTLALLEEGFKEVTIEGIIEDITQMAIARDEIIKAKDKAVEADRLKSLFLANMSHEIRTPMNAIIGFSNMLREESLTNEDRNYFIDVIQNNGNNLVSLIDSIVDFSKLEAEQMSVSMGEFNINPLIESVIDHAEKSLISEGKNHIKVIKGDRSEHPVRIVSDRHRLNQVFMHLISNAVKFTDEGEIEIGYTLENGFIRMYVKDSGIGIDPGKFEYIFQRFNKIEDKNRLYGGTGLGLTISKGLVELMGGAIEVSSELGKGSAFYIILPYLEQNNIL